jgi:hypothetical protein
MQKYVRRTPFASSCSDRLTLEHQIRGKCTHLSGRVVPATFSLFINFTPSLCFLRLMICTDGAVTASHNASSNMMDPAAVDLT